MTTYTMEEVATLTGVAPRTVRHYQSLGLLPRPRYAGNQTRYDGIVVARLHAIRALRARGLVLGRIKAELAKKTIEQLEAIGGAPVSATAATTRAPGMRAALPPASTRAPTPTMPVPSSMPSEDLGADGLDGAGERWRRVALLPGLELGVREDASAIVRAIAGEIRRRYGS